jgi:HSP20 family protein
MQRKDDVRSMGSIAWSPNLETFMPRPANDVLPPLQRSARHFVAPLQRDVGRLLHDLGDGWDAFGELAAQPPMDVLETDAGLEISLELPGLAAKDLTLTLEDDLLTICGGAPDQPAFRRSVYLPRSIDVTTIEAVLAQGVLEISAGRRPEAEVEIIPVRSV